VHLFLLTLKIKHMKKIILTKDAPLPIGPYSQAIEINGILFVSGQIPINPKTKKIASGGIIKQTERVFKNIEAILKSSGYSFHDVVKTTCLLLNLEDYKDMNIIYEKYFKDNPPVRIAFSAKQLPLNSLIEIDLIAIKEK
jgi:2-iminobutanoate/2-iminopropanoate deaminase